MRIHRTYAEPGTLLASLLASLIAARAFAQVIPWPPPPALPSAPTNLSPSAATTASTPATLRWRQGGFFALQPQPPVAQFFRVCVYDTAAQQSCGTPAAQWFYAANDPLLHRTPVIPPFNPPPIVSTHAYRFQLPSNAVALDRALTWNVGACSSQSLASCSYSAAAALHLSTKNIVAVNIDEDLGTARITATPVLRNAGTTASGMFDVHLQILPAFYDPSGTCATSVNAEGVEPGDFAVLANGERIELQSEDVPGAVGIYRQRDGFLYSGETRLSVAAGAMARGGTVDQSLAGESLPGAFLVTMYIDPPPEAIVEYDETDNRRAECHVVFP